MLDAAALAADVGGKAAMPPDTPPGQYLRCKGFDAAKLAPFMAPDARGMMTEEVETALGNPLADAPAPEMQKIAREVMAKVTP